MADRTLTRAQEQSPDGQWLHSIFVERSAAGQPRILITAVVTHYRGEEQQITVDIPDANAFWAPVAEWLHREGQANEDTVPVLHDVEAWAIYGRVSGNLKQITTDPDVVAELEEFYDVVPIRLPRNYAEYNKKPGE